MKRQIQRMTLLVMLFAAASLLSSATKSLNQGYLVPSGKTRINQDLLKGELKICALTFDDGPDVRYTMQVHDILREEGIRATFFVVGRNVDRYPEQVIALAEYGHEIANHTYTHRDMLKLSKADIREEIRDTSDILGKLGITPKWFRPPYGSYNSTVVNIAAEFDLDTMLWSVDPQDWMRPGAAVIENRVTGRTGPGSVVLMHSTVSQTVDALPGIIAKLRRDGYSFVTASEWQQLVSGTATLDSLDRFSGYSMPLHLPDPSKAGIERADPPPAGLSGMIGGGMPADADVWQRVPAGEPGNAERQLTVYANFVDDNDLRRVLSDGTSRNMIEAEGAVGSGLARVLEGMPPHQIVAVVDEPGDYRDGRESVEVQIIDAPPAESEQLLAAALEQEKQMQQNALDAASGQPAAAEAQPAVRMPEAAPAGDDKVAIAGSTALSMNLASTDYAASIPANDDGGIVFISHASSVDAAEWRWLENYMRLCGLEHLGYADGFSASKAPADFPFADAASRGQRERLVLGMFSPKRWLDGLSARRQYFIPLRSTDLSKLEPASMFDGVTNGYREFMLIRHFTLGLQLENDNAIPAAADSLATALFSDTSGRVLVIASISPGIELDLPAGYRSWQRVTVDAAGRLESREAGAHISDPGRLVILVDGSGD